MESPQEVIAAAMKSGKKSKLQMILNFLMYGGWILVIAVGLGVAIALDVYF